MRPRSRSKVNGNDILYHFLQKTLLESDEDQFRELTTRLINELGVWLPTSIYSRFPLLVPYAIRDPYSRGNRATGKPDEWGAPSSSGYFRDDNSLIKGVPRGFPIHNPANPLMDRRKLGTGFVASHVWRVLVGGGHANREPQTYSFVPNVVWLPSQVSKLTDREGLFVQSYLQALSARIYRGLKLNPKLEVIVAPIWDQLEVRPEVAGVAMPDPGALNYFEVSENWLTRRVKTVNLVISGIEAAQAGSAPERKTISSRYTEGLPDVSPDALASLHSWLATYAGAIEEAAPQTDPGLRSRPRFLAFM